MVPETNELTTERPVLYEYFERQAVELLASYQKSGLQDASANKGANRELFCSGFLSKVLPTKLNVGKGEIWDSAGGKTGQLDVVVFRDDAPRLTFGGNETYLAEGVFAVIEVKSNLTRNELKDALDKMNRVKLLKPQPSWGMTSGLFLGRPLRLIFAYEGATWDTLEDELVKQADTAIVDLISVLSRGFTATKGGLLKWEPESNFGGSDGKAAALAFMYYYLVTYGTAFMAGSFDLGPYFTPFGAWDERYSQTAEEISTP